MEQVETIAELIQVAYAIDAHTMRVRLFDSASWARSTIEVVGASAAEVVIARKTLAHEKGASAFAEVWPDRAWDVVELELERTRLEIRSVERKPRPLELEQLAASQGTSVRLPVGASC